jgi:chromate reductase, NAD(P)H dehydrogenase (quinone)
MNQPLTILGIAGSLRKKSYNRAALRAAQQLAPENVNLEIFELYGIPAFNQDEEQNPPEKVTQLKARIRAADAILLVTPEYNYSIPGFSKMLLTGRLARGFGRRTHGRDARGTIFKAEHKDAP